MYLYHYCNSVAKLRIIFLVREIFSIKIVITILFNHTLTLFVYKLPLSDLKYQEIISWQDSGIKLF